MTEISIERFTGYTGIYDLYRPKPPAALTDLLLDIMNTEHAHTVTDLGCGTGLSTVIWADKADRIIGIEPNNDMRNKAMNANYHKSIRYVNGTSYDTGLKDRSVDVVTCSQSFHWMEPKATLKECGRILKKKGLLAVYDNDWPPLIEPECDRAYRELFRQVRSIFKDRKDCLPKEKQYPKEKHLENIERSGIFDFVREMIMHNTEICDYDRFVGIALSQGSVQTLLKNGIPEINSSIGQFKKRVKHSFAGNKKRTMWTTYRIRIGIVEKP